MKAHAVVLVGALCTLRAATAATPADYATVFPIETPTAIASSAWRIELTPAVYTWSQDASLRDIEIFNAAGQAVPLARIASSTTSTLHKHDTALPALALPTTPATPTGGDLRLLIASDADGRLRPIVAAPAAAPTAQARDWLLDASAVAYPIDNIQLDWTTPVAGVVARFSIEAGDDLQNWRSIGSATVLSLEQDGARLQRRELALGGVHARYIRLHRLDDGPDLAGLGAHAYSIERGNALPARAWLPAEAAVHAAAASNAVQFQYSLTAAVRVERARIELADDNTLAPLVLFARTAGTSSAWIELASTTAFRLHEGDERLQNDEVDLRGDGRLREFKLESRTPLASAPHLTLAYQPDAIVFLAEGGAPYTLAVGSGRAQHAQYPVDAALASLRAKFGHDWQPPQATLGTAKVSAGDAALRAPPSPLPWRRWILWSILVAGAALVGAFALNLLRGARRDR